MTEAEKTKNKTIVFQLSAILILIAAFGWQFYPAIAPYVMTLGVAGFAGVTFTTPYPGKGLRGKRLFNIQILGVLLMIVATCLMYAHVKEWMIALLVAGLLTLFCSFMLPKVYKQEQEEDQDKK